MTVSWHRPPRLWTLLFLLFPGLLTAGALAGDWPQFRGPDRSGVSDEAGLLRAWPPDGPKVLWRKAVGEAFSGIAVAGGRLLTGALDGESEAIVALGAATGEEIWRTPIGPKFEEEFGNGPRSTPTVAGDAVYALSSTGRLVALRAADGTKLWEVDLQAAQGSQQPQRGFSSSPLVDGDLVLVEAGGKEGKGLLALDRRTGKVAWSAMEGRPGYSSLIAADIDGVRQYVLVPTGGNEVIGISTSGQILWRQAWQPGSIATPVFVPPNRIFVSAADDAGGLLLAVETVDGKPVPREVWRSPAMKNHFGTSVFYRGHLYGFDNATLKCLAADSGEVRWVQRGFGKGTLLAADGLLFILGDRGALAIAEAEPAGYKELGRIQALRGTAWTAPGLDSLARPEAEPAGSQGVGGMQAPEGKAWTAPSLAGGRLFLRNQTEIVCLDVAAAAAAGK